MKKIMLKESIAQTNYLLDKLTKQSLTETKADLIDDTNSHSVDTYAIKALEETEFDVLNCKLKSGFVDIAPLTMLQGDVLYVNAKDITLASGRILYY